MGNPTYEQIKQAAKIVYGNLDTSIIQFVAAQQVIKQARAIGYVIGTRGGILQHPTA